MAFKSKPWGSCASNSAVLTIRLDVDRDTAAGWREKETVDGLRLDVTLRMTGDFVPVTAGLPTNYARGVFAMSEQPPLLLADVERVVIRTTTGEILADIDNGRSDSGSQR